MTESTMEFAYYSSPIGRLILANTDESLCGLWFEDTMADIYQKALDQSPVTIMDGHSKQGVLKQTCQQLDSYFAGTLKQFDLPVADQGTDFQRRVWAALRQIPYAQTWSYQQLAQTLGDIKAVRAVGTANGRNPISIITPCHRVIGKDGRLTGYAGGLEKKEFLLNLEKTNG